MQMLKMQRASLTIHSVSPGTAPENEFKTNGTNLDMVLSNYNVSMSLNYNAPARWGMWDKLYFNSKEPWTRFELLITGGLNIHESCSITNTYTLDK